MGTYDVTIYTATCDVGDCESTYGDDDDWSWDWSEWQSEAEEIAIRGGWTRVDGVLICKVQDEEHAEARGDLDDGRPKPGAGQLALL